MVHNSRKHRLSGSALNQTENDVTDTVLQSQRFDETKKETSSSSTTVPQTFAPLLAPSHHCSSVNSLPTKNCRSEIIQSPLHRLVKVSPNTSVVIEELCSFRHDSYCVHKEAMSENCNHCRNNNTEPTLPGGLPPRVQVECTYKGTVRNNAPNERKIKKSRLVIIVLVCIIAGLAAGLVYFRKYQYYI